MQTTGPEFERPPVAEVALAVYFARPLRIPSAQLGRLWARWSDQYPRTEDQPPLPAIPIESFPAPPNFLPFQVMGGFPGPRVWFLSEDGNHVLQLQADRLILNWRKSSTDDTYPHYDQLRPKFAAALQQFLDHISGENLGPLDFSQAEVTYINPVPINSLGSLKDVSLLVAPWTGKFTDEFLPDPEDVRLALRFQIPNPQDGTPAGRLYVEGNSAFHQSLGDNQLNEVYMLQLFARGRPLGEGVEGVLKFLDLGHSYVVNGFASITATEIKREWGYKS